MMISRSISGFLLALVVSDAVVVFPGSRIYDEFDFKGQPNVTIDGLCSVSCRIFASITPDSRKTAMNLLIQMPKGFYSVGGIAESIDPATNQKIPLEINKMASVTIVNANGNFAAGPLVLYVVDNSNNPNEFYNQPEVYEAEVLRRPVSKLPKSVTVMSATPFTIKQAPLQGELPQGLLATMTGYDHMDEGFCPYLYYSTYEGPFPGFTMEVNGPIVSIMWDYYDFDYAPGTLTGSLGITNKQKLQRSGWVSSPGYHGCPGVQPYRSSLYDFSSPFRAEITSDKPAQLSLDIATNSDDDHPVNIHDEDNFVNYGASDMTDGSPFGFQIASTSNFTVTWQPYDEKAHFLVRWNVTAKP